MAQILGNIFRQIWGNYNYGGKRNWGNLRCNINNLLCPTHSVELKSVNMLQEVLSFVVRTKEGTLEN